MSPIPLEVVVVGELSPRGNVLQGKNTNAESTSHQPLLSLAVGHTGMIDEPGCAAHHRGIDLKI